MKKRKDLLEFIKASGLRMTSSKEMLIQFFLDNKNRIIPFKELQEYAAQNLPNIDRSTLYRNIEKFISLELIQELNLASKGKAYQFIFGKKVHHFYTCKVCGKVKRGHDQLFDKIESALKEIHDFSKANMSIMFYGYCTDCETLRSAGGRD